MSQLNSISGWLQDPLSPWGSSTTFEILNCYNLIFQRRQLSVSFCLCIAEWGMQIVSYLTASIVRVKLKALLKYFPLLWIKNQSDIPEEVHLDIVKPEHSVYSPCYHILGKQLSYASVLFGFGDRSEKPAEGRSIIFLLFLVIRAVFLNKCI